MELLSLSTTVSSYSLSSHPTSLSIKHRTCLPKTPSFSFRPHSPSIIKCSLDFPKLTSPNPSKTLFGLGLEPQEPNAFSLNPPTVSQSASAAMRGAETDAMGLLLRERIVFLGSEIDDFNADAVISQLLLLDAQDPKKDIRLFINSVGGSMSATMAIYDIVKLLRADVSTIALGISASTASVILAGGTKGKRLAMPNTRIMIHQPLGGASGQVLDVEIQAKELQHSKDNVVRIISETTGRPFEQVMKDLDRDRYMSPMEAVEYGIIDGVIDKDTIIPIMPLPDRVKPKLGYEDFKKFIKPDIPDDEIY